MSLLPASEATSFVEVFLSFLVSEIPGFYLLVNVHCIGVASGKVSRRGWSMESSWGMRRVLFHHSSAKCHWLRNWSIFSYQALGVVGITSMA